jgi:hypothetical protein
MEDVPDAEIERPTDVLVKITSTNIRSLQRRSTARHTRNTP